VSSEIVPISVIKKRKTPTGAYIDAYETSKPHIYAGFSRRSRKLQRAEITPEFAFEDFQAEPITKAIAKIPSQKMSDTAQKLLSKQKQSSLSRVSSKQMSTAKPRSEKSRKSYKKMFDDVVNIQDASFTEDFDDKEPPAIAAISAPKIKSQLAKVESVEKSPSFASDGFRVEPSSIVKHPKKAKNVDTNWLIDKAFDELYNTGKVVGKATGKAIKEGYKATRTGIKAINTITGDIIDNPAMKNIARQHEATMQGMANKARRARGSIIATGNNANKRYMSAGSLVTQHGFVNRTNTGTTVGTQRVFPKIVHRKGGDIVKYFSASGIEISAATARRILGNAPLPTVNNQAVETTSTYQNARTLDTGIRGVVNPIDAFQKQGNPKGKVARSTIRSRLITRNHSTVVNISRVITPSRLVYRHMEA